MNHNLCCANDSGSLSSSPLALGSRTSAGAVSASPARLASSILLASPSTVPSSKILLTPISTPNTARIREITCVANNEWPPRSKKCLLSSHSLFSAPLSRFLRLSPHMPSSPSSPLPASLSSPLPVSATPPDPPSRSSSAATLPSGPPPQASCIPAVSLSHIFSALPLRSPHLYTLPPLPLPSIPPL